MKNPVRTLWSTIATLFMLLVVGAAQADEGSAHALVKAATDEVMAVVRDAEDYAEEDPERYYSEVMAVLDPVVDFRGFARGVMGPYATRDRYRSLDEAGREKLRGQLDKFTEVMRDGLVRTYSKGLLAFGGSRIELTDEGDEAAGERRATVRQLIYSEQTEPYVVLYQMGKDRSGAWKLRNMIIESVNLGEVYRSQFEASARRLEGDLDAVIDSWTVQELET
ncbi:MlaC/ttg2D family ABC transporter substrate-binding protein [Halioglobus pacificus]|uniref:Phospholipid transport system substrate-binding protein n=1 Tax=Parahalioglobus pacificus TaxID=930806 RepID=A0A918XD87_9GAMM|nr:ABC transporter substrate-binding protein [Halioglobus pacificus]NQY02158.1 ABC transporter substrate-binding protein [Halieaceae bacterium]GHD25833.1 hypothetical protein GCM10007053_02100 [Halioglobus pacificus]